MFPTFVQLITHPDWLSYEEKWECEMEKQMKQWKIFELTSYWKPLQKTDKYCQ